MLTLATLNMEGARHFTTVANFIADHTPDVLCLQEMPGAFTPLLMAMHYEVTFVPMTQNHPTAPGDILGIALATKRPHAATPPYFYTGELAIIPTFTAESPHLSIRHPLLTGSYEHDGHTYHFATVHHPVTKDGHSDTHQKAATDRLITHLGQLTPHLLCGDFNMPRGYNTNYEAFTALYVDAVPTTYTSSLDRDLHRAGQRANLNAPIFDTYLVDYIFTQSPYQATDVQLHFGVSDHAAITATIQHL